jgi:hypothetical protein
MLAFVFGMGFAMAGTVLAIAATTLAITTWADRDSAAPIPPTEAIYQPQHLNLY